MESSAHRRQHNQQSCPITFYQLSLEPTTLRPAVTRRSWASTSNPIVPEGSAYKRVSEPLLFHGEKYKWPFSSWPLHSPARIYVLESLRTEGGGGRPGGASRRVAANELGSQRF